ncbi:MAG: hypothetical protein AB1440_24315 [Pseudomonadota bacterium]|jgi:hypothetical protein
MFDGLEPGTRRLFAAIAMVSLAAFAIYANVAHPIDCNEAKSKERIAQAGN